jgi:integrase
MRNPNGYGTVFKLSGARRRPYTARKTVDWNDKGQPKYMTIGYFATRQEAMLALAQFNNDPWDVDAVKTTLAELYALWLKKAAPKLGERNRASMKSAYRYCEALAGLKYRDIGKFHMQECIDNCGFGYSTQSAIKNLFGHLDRFAFDLKLINRMCSETLESESVPETKKVPFTDEEAARLWAISSEPWVDSVLVFLYTGFRISELLSLRLENVDLETGTLKGGTKTEAGKNRIVPIHSRIEPFIRARYELGGEYLFGHNGGRCSEKQYYIFWRGIMERLGVRHTPHECRHTFRSRLDSAGANKRCIDLIMGHSSQDVGERVYTHKTVAELKAAIELITD